MAKIASQAPATRTGRPNAAKPSLSDSRGLDIATVLGLTAAFGLVALAIVTGGTPNSFVDPAALMIVIGGTFGVTMMGFSLGEILTAQRVVLKALFRTQRAPRRAANYALQVAEAARGKGVLAIEQILPRMRSEKFLFKALSLVVDGVPADELYKVMERERQATYVRHKASSAVLRRSAEVAPSMGLIGTLVGLVQMLGRLEDPSTIGPAMAVALLTTFYGAILATMVFSPLANKLERNAAEESLVNHIFTITAAAVARQDNPRKLEMNLNTILSPSDRSTRYN